MIIQPPLDKLMEKVDSRYTLVIATAKRARQLTEDPEKKSDKPVIDAVQDIINDRVIIYYSDTDENESEENNVESQDDIIVESEVSEETAAEEPAEGPEEE